MYSWDTEIKYLSGVGPKRAELLEKELNIKTFKDLLFYFPYKHIDRSKFHKIKDIFPHFPYIQLVGKFRNFKTEGSEKKRLVGEFYDDTGSIYIYWFQGHKYITKKIKIGQTYVVFGKPNFFNNSITLIHPEIEKWENFKKNKLSLIQPEYSTTEKLKKNYINSKFISKLIANLFSLNLKIEETLPKYLVKNLDLMPLEDALKNIHFPKDYNLLELAQYRLKFEEFFINQLGLLRYRKFRQRKITGFKMKVGKLFNEFYNNKLPFELTNAQKRVLKEIYSDFKSGKQCNRLIQGDVGSGKTLVALMSALIAIDSGYQVCLMAPTEILAKQHFNNIRKFLDGLEVNIRILTGSTKTKQRRIIDEELQSGELDFLVGTHALIEDSVKFKNLGLAIIDEQHRFGVVQRAKLWKKNKFPPHVLVMSATPIPRTLSMTLYGDLDISIIDELPPGRKPIKTIHITESKRKNLYSFIRKQIQDGRQIYIVYPLINESEKLDYNYLEEGYEILKTVFPPPKYNIVVLHGKMKPEEKEEAMKIFASGEAQIMVATQVIEVGVDVPNATVIVIESAERFGLSQLHQLRGRVGRGDKQSYCILVTKDKLSSEARTRIKTMVETNDGFKIAEVDLRLRGPGDIFGTQQSGMPLKFKIANLITDQHILKRAREIAEQILKKDPLLENPQNAILNQRTQKNIKSLIGYVG